jgi:hypothetical protein
VARVLLVLTKVSDLVKKSCVCGGGKLDLFQKSYQLLRSRMLACMHDLSTQQSNEYASHKQVNLKLRIENQK